MAYRALLLALPFLPGCTTLLGDFEVGGGADAAVVEDGSTPPDGGTRVCEPQSRKCEENRLLKCRVDGSAYDVEQTCNGPCDVTRSQCSDCPSGKVRCNGKRREKCSADGRTFDLVQECSGPELCDEAADVCYACPAAGASVCVGAEEHTCNADKKGTTLVRRCGAVGCNATTGRCNQCNPVQAQCGPTEFCDAPSCGANGYCAPRPSATSTRMDLVCGCDGVSYWNKQHANWLGKAALKDPGYSAGHCRQGKPCDKTSGAGCGAGEYCNAYAGRFGTCGGPTQVWSQCFNKPQNVACPSTPDNNGAQFCGGGCTNDCVGFSSFQWQAAEGCGA